ncbi:MAG: hypothetical protein L0Z62_17385 [Gemmataceae bacterium]|nr:hypothetical protein [Gemmataceae bacterium]
MTIPDHCWHDTGRVAESYPPLYEQKCCVCGETKFTRREALVGGRLVPLPWAEEAPAHDSSTPVKTACGEGSPATP